MFSLENSECYLWYIKSNQNKINKIKSRELTKSKSFIKNFNLKIWFFSQQTNFKIFRNLSPAVVTVPYVYTDPFGHRIDLMIRLAPEMMHNWVRFRLFFFNNLGDRYTISSLVFTFCFGEVVNS